MNAAECSGLCFRRGKKNVLKEVSFVLKEGTITALIGHNGAGKSTLVKILLGLIRPLAGKVSVLGQAPGLASSQIGYLPENAAFYSQLTVRENLIYFGRLRGISEQRADALLDALNISAVAHQKVSRCSKGQRQRLGLAQAILHEPKLLLLDEPTVGLDPEASDLMYRELRRLRDRGSCVLVCTHELLLAEKFIDQAIVMKEGRVAAQGSLPTLCSELGLPVELIAPQILAVCQSDKNLSGYLRDGAVRVRKEELEFVLDYLRTRHGITGVAVRESSLLDVYKTVVMSEE